MYTEISGVLDNAEVPRHALLSMHWVGERLEILTTPPYFGFFKTALEGFGMRIDPTFKLESIAVNRGADTGKENQQRNALLATEGLARNAERRGVDAVANECGHQTLV
jgi:hypothetical protein